MFVLFVFVMMPMGIGLLPVLLVHRFPHVSVTTKGPDVNYVWIVFDEIYFLEALVLFYVYCLEVVTHIPHDIWYFVSIKIRGQQYDISEHLIPVGLDVGYNTIVHINELLKIVDVSAL